VERVPLAVDCRMRQTPDGHARVASETTTIRRVNQRLAEETGGGSLGIIRTLIVEVVRNRIEVPQLRPRRGVVARDLAAERAASAVEERDTVDEVVLERRDEF